MKKLKAKVKDLKEVDEKYHELYTKQEDGTFRLDAEGMETDDEVEGLKNALKRERELNSKKKEDGLTAAEKEELATLRKEREEADAKKLADEKNWKGLEERLTKKHAAETEALNAKAKKAQDRLYKTLKENAATQAIVKAKGRVAPLLPHVMNQLDVIEDGEELKVVVKGSDGKPRYSKDKPKDEMSVDDLIKSDFLGNEDFMGVFEGKGHSGGGSSGGGNGGRNGGAVTISQSDAKDARKYAAAKAEAAKLGQAAPVVVADQRA